MSNGWIAFVVSVWIVGALLGAAYDKDWDQLSTNTTGYESGSKLNYLMNFRNISYQSDSAGTQHFVGVNTEYFNTLGSVLTFDFGFFPDDMRWLHWMIFAPFGIAIVYGLIALFISILSILL